MTITPSPEALALKPCPFCGAAATLHSVSFPIGADCADIQVACGECDSIGPSVLFDYDSHAEADIPELEAEAIAAWNQRPTPTDSGEVIQGEALAKALCLLDSFAGEGFAHTYGNGQTLDAAEVCSELANAVGVECEPGWWRTVGRLAFSRPEPVGDEALVERVKPRRLPKLSQELYECYPAMSAQQHEEHVKAYARTAIQAIPAPATDAGQSADSGQDRGRLIAFVRRVARTRKGGIPGVSDQQHQAAIIREWRRDAANLLDTLSKEASDGAVR